MMYRAGIACAALAASLWFSAPAMAEEKAAPAQPKPKSGVVVDVRSDRIVLMDIAQAGNRIIAVGERGFTLVSDDGGRTWKGSPTAVNRQLTGLAFRDDKVGVAVGHGGSFVRTEDGGTTWSSIAVDEAGEDSLLGVTHLGGDHFIAYGAFGLYFDSQDAGKTWQRRTVLSEDFDRHISQVIAVGSSLLLVAESGTLARSDDGGATWVALTSPYQGSYFGPRCELAEDRDRHDRFADVGTATGRRARHAGRQFRADRRERRQRPEFRAALGHAGQGLRRAAGEARWRHHLRR
jgi:photosystem II stability/assembly factor-like uncharacterized protein